MDRSQRSGKLVTIVLPVLMLMQGALFAQNSASALLPSDVGATWNMTGIQTDSAGNQQSYNYQETLENLSADGDELLYLINRSPGSSYQIRTHGDTLFTDIRNAIGGLLPEGIDVESIQFESPWVGFVRTDIEPGTEWPIAQLQLRVAMPDELKAAFPSLATPRDTMDVAVNIKGIRGNDGTRTLDFEEVNVVSYITEIELIATVYFLIFGQQNSLPITLLSAYEITNEYSEGLGLVYRNSDVYEVYASASYLSLFNFEEYLFTIPGNESTMTSFSTGTSIADAAGETAGRFELLQNYPNPFNPATSIRFSLDRPGSVYLDVYSINGQHIATLSNGIRLGSGLHTAQFDGRNVASGIYLYRIRVVPDDGSGLISAVRRMMLIK